MKKRVAFRSFVILLAAVMLLSSTSAYNILVYANQDSVANSLSAIGSLSEDAVTEPNIAVQGGSLELNSDEGSMMPSTVTWIGDGSEQNPYQISSVAHFMEVNAMVNGTKAVIDATQKHFILTADIDLAEWFALHNDDINNPPYVNKATNAYLVSTVAGDANKYIKIDGAYVENGRTYKHKIYISDSTQVAVKNYENFALFGYLSAASVISNIIFENINVTVSTSSAQRIAIIAYCNEGKIIDCELNNCSINVSYKSSDSSVDGAGDINSYFGVAGAVADNRYTVSAVKANNFTISFSPVDAVTNDYVATLVAQNRGTVEKSIVSGIKFELGDKNHYIGGMVAYNVSNVEGCRVDMAGDNNVKNISGGGFVGGLVGYNESSANITNCSVTGTFDSSRTPDYSDYNMYCKPDVNNSLSDDSFFSQGLETPSSYGGIAGINKGTITKSTVADLGFYMGLGTTTNSGFFGGIAAVSSGGKISACVASGSFVSANSTKCYAGGIIGYAKSTDSQIVNNCYAFVKLSVPSANLVGAVVGYGGNSNTAINTYWSDAVSGCLTSYVIPNTDSEKPFAIENFVGNLNSSNRAVVVPRNEKVTVAASELGHSFTKIDGAEISTALVSVNDDIQLPAYSSNNSLNKYSYTANIIFPTDASSLPLVGSEDKQNLAITFSLDVMVTTTAGDPDSSINPLVIGASSLAKYIYLAPYGHYKLGTNIAVSSDTWSVCDFTGTIDGNGKLLSTDTPLFNYVVGSRTTQPEKSSDNVTSPDNDNSDRSCGYISDLTVELSNNIKTAIFGTVYDATFVDVNLTDSDPTPDDGKPEHYEGYIAQITNSYTAAFINCAVGYSYIYGCSTDVSVTMSNVSNVAAFIAYLSGSVIVDNCAVNSVSAYVEGSNSERAVFLGNVKDNTNGFVLNSIVSARVVGSGRCYIVMGPNNNQYAGYYKNIVWSKLQYESSELDSSNMNTLDIALWGSSDKNYSSVVKSATAGSIATHTITIPQNVYVFENASIGDFDISLITIEDGVETAYTSGNFVINNTSVDDSKLTISVNISADAQEKDGVWVKVSHYETGFLTYAKIQVVVEEFGRGDDGYYHISTPSDLIAFSELCNNVNLPEYLTYAYKIDNDIDMAGYEYTPAASGGNPFTGYISAQGEDGKIYTIKNLTIVGSGNVALIASAVSGGTVTVKNKEGVSSTVHSGIYNIRIENATITATGENSNAAVLLATSNVNKTATEYGRIVISNIEIVDSTVVSAGKNTAAIIADTVNTSADIQGITLTNVSVQTTYSSISDGYFNATEAAAVGGLGGVIGTVGDTIYVTDDLHRVSVKNVNIDGLKLSGLLEGEDAYATVNAGAVVGSYLKWYSSDSISNNSILTPELTIGDINSSNEFDIRINNLYVKAAGITGGVLGATNVRTEISKVKLSSATPDYSEILSTTVYFIGGIAGHIGSYDSDHASDSYAVDNIYGVIRDCLVENTHIFATNAAISSSTTALSRNVAVGGIVGAINGPATGETVKHCTVKDSAIEGVVVGGIVGSNVERTFVDGNRIRISECNVINSNVGTSEACYPAAVNYTSTVASFGVGGILGTNRYSQSSYASDVEVKYCTVDNNTSINDYTVLGTDVYVATGGIIGSAVTYYDSTTAESIALQYNEVTASIYTLADAKITAAVSFRSSTSVRMGTAGFIGVFGSVDNSLSGINDIAYFNYVTVSDSVFGGSITAADCIGGVIGSVINTTTCIAQNGNYLPESPILDNIIVSGTLSSSATSTALIRGGVVIGHIVYSINTAGTSYFRITEPYGLQAEIGTTIESIITDIYYSSFTIDTTKFPFLGFCGLNPSSMSTLYTYAYPVTDAAKATLVNSYIDVNCKLDNNTAQLPQRTESVEFTISGADAPLVNRGIFRLGTVNGNQSVWKTSNKSIAAVSQTTYETVTVTPKSKSTTAVEISIDYCGVITDNGGWEATAYLSVGFLLFSLAEKVLETVVIDGQTYYLISEPLDFNYIEMDYKCLLKNDIEFTPDLFDATGIFKDGFVPLGTEEEPFTGSLSSMPEGPICTISGLEFALGTAKNSDGTPNYGTYSVVGLFGYASGATFKNFNISNVSSSVASDYAASLVAVVKDSVVAENIIVEDANISGAKYSAGLFGGMFSGNESDTPWVVKNCSLVGTRIGTGDEATYSTVIDALNGAAGIVAHTDENAAALSGITVSGSYITQSSSTMDTTNFDNGAAGISLSYSGIISADGAKRNVVIESLIVGEVASGVVMHSYSSASDAAFTPCKITNASVVSEMLTISAVDVTDTHIIGNIVYSANNSYQKLVTPAGVLAHPACSGISHTITDCVIDEKSIVESALGAGGIVGTLDEATGTSSSAVAAALINLTIDNCKVSATIKMSAGKVITSSANNYFYNQLGAGGIIGILPRIAGTQGIHIRNCVVDGTISGVSAIGGVIGAMWTRGVSGANSPTMIMSNRTNHLVENCVVSADFLTQDGAEAFSAGNRTTGLIVGYIYDVASTSYLFTPAANAGFNDNNHPFYNIYFSGYKYPADSTYIFGIINPGSTGQKSMNYLDDGNGNNKYRCYTDYIYDIDFSTDAPIVIDTSYCNIVLSDNYRVQQTLSEENGIWVIDNRMLGSGKDIKLNEFTFNTAPVAGAQSALTYRFDENATLNGFTLSDAAGTTESSVAVLKEVKTTSPLVSITKISDDTYKLFRMSTLAKTLVFDLVFVYSNGLELVAPFRIEVSSNDYYFAPNGRANGTDYFVFNAANLNSTLELTLGPNDRVIQCFDIFWTLENSDIQTAVNGYTGNTSLSQAFADISLTYGEGEAEEDKSLLELLKAAKHPNLEFDDTLPPSDKNPENLSLEDYIGLKNGETLESVTLRRLVKEINTVSFGTYGDKEASSLYEKDFAAEYTVLKSVTEGKSTGLTESGEYYSIYGLEIHAVNTNAQKADATHTGLFKSLVSGASVTGLTFVNPRIEVVGAKAEENYAGVLAGTASDATITDVSVERFADGDAAYISSIRWMTAASTNVGGIVGKADAATTIKNASVNGIDVVGASLAGSDTKSLRTVMAGGIAGVSEANITESSVSNSRILIERNDRYRNYYLSYAGGIAARATGNISDVTVSNTVMRDCTCEVIVQDAENSNPYSTYSCDDTALVADRIGGVAAFTDGLLKVTKAVVEGVTVRAFDIAGGILAEVTENATADVSVTESSVVENSDIRVYGSANVASVSSLRQYYNAAGGAVGKIDNLNSLNIDTFNFEGYVGTYSYDNLNKDCTAGGIIGFVTDKLTTLDAIKIYNSTVSGEVSGYRTNKTGNIEPYLGAAGGIIGKINTTAVKSITTDTMVSDCVMGAKVTLYNNASGTSVNANLADPASTASTNVGKILGTLVSKVMNTETNEQVSSNFALDAGNISVYFKDIYISSYPQDIVAYGSQDFYVSQNFSPFTTYTDINKVIVDTQTGESTGALAIGGLDFSTTPAPDYADDEYSELAIIPIDKESNVAGKATRGFRVKQNSIEFGNGNHINFEGNASIVAETDIEGATIEIKTGSTLVNKNDGYYYGTLHIDQVTTDIIGEIVMDYSYGLQINVQFIGMDIKGDGSAITPFEVSEPKHLAVVRVLRDKNYIQINNIDFTSQYSYSDTVPSPLWATIEGFEPIGTANAPFIGSYDGQGKLITNLYISRANTDNVGLFGYVKGTAEKQASISNVHIELAGEMSLSLNENNLSEVTVVPGNVTGKNNVGGLVGTAVNADITNCSVVKGNVIGSNAVGGLVGNASASNLASCFTSTTAFAHADLGMNTPSAKTAGGLVGTVSGSLEIVNSFTLGFVALDPYKVGAEYRNYGAIGGFVGYVSQNVTLDISNAFVGAGVSDSVGNTIKVNDIDVSYRGLTVGAGQGIVKASNVVISSTVAAGDEYSTTYTTLTEITNPIYGTASGAAELKNILIDENLNGSLAGRTETSDAVQITSFSLNGITIGADAIGDAYTSAYKEFASLEIVASDLESGDRTLSYKSSDGTDKKYQVGGFFYPLSIKSDGVVITSSDIDSPETDKTIEYPKEMDTDFFGNDGNKNTDLLFKKNDNVTSVYVNIYDMAIPKDERIGVYNNGIPYDNGELFYDCMMPYFILKTTVDDHELYRKVTYPVQSKQQNGRVYPIATERQLNALAGYESSGAFKSFSLNANYALVDDIVLGDYNFKPISGFEGHFNGNNHTIYNVNIDQSGVDNVGFFKSLTTSRIEDLHLIVESVVGKNCVGGLVGYVGENNHSVIINGCSVTGASASSSVEGNDYVGGLVGCAVGGTSGIANSANISQAGIYDSYTTVTVDGTNIVGGLVGRSEMYITNCYSTGDVIGAINSVGDAPRGIGGLVGVLAMSTGDVAARVTNSFSSSAVDVNEVSAYNENYGNGVGGLIGNVAEGTSISTVFSSGSVRFCYGDNNLDDTNIPPCGSIKALGIGGLVGVLNSNTDNVYSAASVAAKVGELNQSSVVGIGGVAGISNVSIRSAYSSGSTLGTSVTTDIPETYNFGVGGVVGLISSNSAEANNLYFDSNASAVSEKAIGKSNAAEGNLTNIDSKTTKEFTFVADKENGFLGGNFNYNDGAYPYLSNFFADDVSQVIRFNALLSIVAVQLNELDFSAADGEGISMAMDIPTEIIYNGVAYKYGFAADNSVGESATSIVDKDSNTLSFQRTSNEKQPANFTVVIEKVGSVIGENEDGTNIIEYDGANYSSVASRPFSRVTAEMLGSQDKPYLVASQTDLEHVAMSTEELGQAQGLYTQWNTPIDSNGNQLSGKVHYRLMGYVNLNESGDNPYGRSFSTLDGGYSLDGNGYSIRNLSTTLANTLDANSSISNITFENVEFESGESLVGTLNGSAIGVNVYGTAKGSNVAGITQTVGESGLVEGSTSALDYNNSGETATAQSNIAGLALTNNGTINMSASVGNISGKQLTNVSAFVGTNSGTIKNSFTMGDILLDNPAGVVAGFVGTNNGTVEACYTRCNFKIKNAADALTIGSFAGSNISLSEEKIASIASSFAAGLFDVRKADASPIALNSIFVAQNSGTLNDVMFDKQLSGTCFKDIFTYAESTSDIAAMSNHSALIVESEKGNSKIPPAYVPADSEKCEYPQLYSILETYYDEDNYEKLKEKDSYKALSPEEKTILEAEHRRNTVKGRMYNSLRSYSLLSSATAFVSNDNYTDNLAPGIQIPLSYEPYRLGEDSADKFSWSLKEDSIGRIGAIDVGKGKAYNAPTDKMGDAIAIAEIVIEGYHNSTVSKRSDSMNLYFAVDDDGANPNFAGGNGSESSKYQISAPEHVIALSYYGKNSSSYFEVVNDINMSGANWNNSYINIFKANLDGKNHVFYDVEIPENGSNAFIGSLEGGSISNLGLTGITVTTTTNDAAGLLAAKALKNASITNCVVIGELVKTSDENTGGGHIGGLVGNIEDASNEENISAVTISGCVVSGKITATGATFVGGIVGFASDFTTGRADTNNKIFDSLATVLVDGRACSGGIIGGGTAAVTNCIFAGNVKGVTTGNIAGDSTNVTVTNSYYDKQLSTVDGGATASTTHYLTAGADVADFGGNMVWITGFVGYPVPEALASSTGAMLNAVKLASAKITFANGVGAGTSTTFTTATPESVSYKASNESTVSATLGSNGKATTYITVTNGQWKTETSELKLNEVCAGELTYTLDGMTRYVDVEVGKQIQTVNYNITGLKSGDKSIISAITGKGGSATAATAFDSDLSGVLCNDMVFTYDIIDKKISEGQTAKMAQLFKVDTQLPNGYRVNSVTIECADNGTTVYGASDVLVEIGDDGFAYVYIPVSEDNDAKLFNTINITVDVKAITDTWGVRNLFGLFR